ncbi:hypothetical protein ZOSMA_26G00950 [Zostera marina]|uniref:EF-hand domain-containing protein n=1 Tax=Zostera marina TaxID=29655 RepID=A0A0K9PEF4_ZOSMR|nr:hypothetical protein ZOSMA_26G00950 [Zostera marina]
MARKKVKETDSEDELKRAFEVFDKENKDFITIVDLRHIMNNLGEKLPKYLK